MKPLLIGGLAAALAIIALTNLRFLGLCFMAVVGIGVAFGLIAIVVQLWRNRESIMADGKTFAIALFKLGMAVSVVVLLVQGQMLFLILCAACWSVCQWAQRLERVEARLELR